jgi:hypothetical protein
LHLALRILTGIRRGLARGGFDDVGVGGVSVEEYALFEGEGAQAEDVRGDEAELGEETQDLVIAAERGAAEGFLAGAGAGDLAEGFGAEEAVSGDILGIIGG